MFLVKSIPLNIHLCSRRDKFFVFIHILCFDLSIGKPDSKEFDVTLMITLLTNLTPLIHYDMLPLITDITPSADLGRIKYYRNHIAHNKEGKIDNSFFSTAWNDISEV